MEGKIFLIDNGAGSFIERYLKYTLAGTHHEIVATARNRMEVIGVLADIVVGRTFCNVVLLDANLTSNSEEGEDGRRVREYIDKANEILPQESRLKAIGFSAAPMKGYGIHVDFDLTKAGIPKIAKVLDDL